MVKLPLLPHLLPHVLPQELREVSDLGLQPTRTTA